MSSKIPSAAPYSLTGSAKSRPLYENQSHRASGLNLLVAAIILWNTVYLQRSLARPKLRANRQRSDAPVPTRLGAHQPHGRLPVGVSADLLQINLDRFAPKDPISPPPLSVLKIPFRVFSSCEEIKQEVGSNIGSRPFSSARKFFRYIVTP